jgi:tetratricopeptide (TPR) repeat protein
MRTPRVRPFVLLLACVLLGAWPAAARGALTLAIRLPDKAEGASSCPPAALADVAAIRKATQIPFLDGRLCPLEERLFADAADGRLDAFSPLGAALIASGVENAQVLRRYEERQAALLDELRGSAKLSGPPRQQAQVVFEFMHCRILTGGYHTDCTDLRNALDEGRFNCVSASVLFNCLAGELGVRVCGLEVPGHAMSRVLLPEGPLDVETTCPRWFRLLGDPRRQAELAENTTGLAAATADRSQAREVSPAEMAAMIYYNRGVDLLAKKRFDEAATANAKALRLDPQSATARGNLLATVNNWAIALGSADRYAEAADLLRIGLRLDPSYETFIPNYVHVHHQWVEHLCRSGRFEEALEVLARAAAETPDWGYFQQAAQDVYWRWARTLLAQGEPDGEFAVFAQPGRPCGACRELLEMPPHGSRRRAIGSRW